ncbi:DUF4383 domain-containing protein [Catenuloplanes atrovinosus]|uniref:DUF4383 domain-containing protein n=1 Tax=Catenuloplanes atrovinosus TaxID=137266 RepID=A0AAE4CF42_9ACTN|nr:DUF4383 domain-containing protein [Catenuloplanes atrovinosus]MDR7280664.1 hypothetical protein [Catenuloplanes atrovinosus]
MASHMPVNHPLRPIYRIVGGLSGLYMIVFGVLGAIQTGGEAPLGIGVGEVLLQGTNLANSLLSIAIGALVVLGTVIGRNADTLAYTYLGWAMLVIGMLFLAITRTDANVLNHTVNTTIVWFVVGTLLITAGLYSRSAPVRREAATSH